MPVTDVRPWRIFVLVGCVFLLTAYLPHPNLGEPLPQSLRSLLKG